MSVGNKALFDAIEKGKVDRCLQLVEGGANVNEKCGVKGHRYLMETPLSAAAAKNLESVCAALVAKGASKTERNRRGKTPLEMMSAYGSEALKALLMYEGAPDPQVQKPMVEKGAKPTDPKARLLAAIEAGDEAECLRLLHEEQAPAHYQTDYQFSPLIAASKKGLSELCFELLSMGADVNCANRYYSTPLLVAVANGHNRLAFELLQRGADLHIKNVRGKSALDCASAPMRRRLERWDAEHGKAVTA
eukprot:TRINITY_DN7480_c0_g1_i1.p1 TRINITY_DN7480_c0_g1~~TRINITY_DN7480_c0_g1_i1.p1  ORF type:complete len:248 (+),score=89.63 TRINITY_DN7480_c0_g1_i1:95-838(+)